MGIMERPLATVEFDFTGRISGNQLMGLVRQQCEDGEYVAKTRYANGSMFMVGKSCAHENVLIAPTLDFPYIRAGSMYHTMLVVSYMWPTKRIVAVKSDVDQIAAAISFARILEAAAEEAYVSGKWPVYDSSSPFDSKPRKKH